MEDGRRFLEEMEHLKAIEVDQHSSIYVRTALNPEAKQGMEKLSMSIPKKILMDGRGVPVPAKHAGGRPKQKATTEQVNIFEVV